MPDPDKLLPVRSIRRKTPRLSQQRSDLLPAFRRKLLKKVSEYVRFFAGKSDYNISVITRNGVPEIDDHPTFDQHEMVLSPYDELPTVIHASVADAQSAHAVLCIYFPAGNTLDIVSTYRMDPVDIRALTWYFETVYNLKNLTVNDVACDVVSTHATRNRVCLNLQAEDTVDIGWCVAWMLYFTYTLSRPANHTFWSKGYAERLKVYADMYQTNEYKLVGGLDKGKEVWNMLIRVYNTSDGGKKRKTKKRKRT